LTLFLVVNTRAKGMMALGENEIWNDEDGEPVMSERMAGGGEASGNLIFECWENG